MYCLIGFEFRCKCRIHVAEFITSENAAYRYPEAEMRKDG
jgi:hypothetical protein